MLSVTDRAIEKIGAHFEDRPRRPVRVTADTSACGSSALELAEDRVREADVVFERDGIQIVVERNFLAAAEPIRIDFAGRSFVIDSAYRNEDACCRDCCGCD